MIDKDSSRKDVLAAVAQDGYALEYASDELRGDREVVLTAVAHHGFALRHAPAELRGDRQVVLTAVAQDGYALEYASEALRGDRAVVLTAVAHHYWALRHASAELRGDREFILKAVAQHGCALQHASDNLRGDREVVLTAVAPHYYALQHASAELRGDREFILKAVAQHGCALRHASDKLRGDREVVLTAVARHHYALQHASAELRGDREFILAAVAQNGWALQHASPALRGDRDVVSVAKRERGYEDILLKAIHNNPSLIQFFPTIPDEEIKLFFDDSKKDSCRAKTLLLPTYIDKNSLDKIQSFIKAQGKNHFTVKLLNDKEIDYKFKTSLAEQMLGAINWQSSSEPEPEPEPEHSEIFDANHRRQFNPVYFGKIKISLYGLFLPMLRKTAVSKIPVELLSMLFGLRLQGPTVCLFEHLTTKDLSKYMQVCRPMSHGFFIKDVVVDSASPRSKEKDCFEPTSAEAAAAGERPTKRRRTGAAP